MLSRKKFYYIVIRGIIMNKLIGILMLFMLLSCEKNKSTPVANNEILINENVIENIPIKQEAETIPFDATSTDLNYLERNRFEYFKTIETPNIDFSLIQVSNCIITADFSLPDISSMHIGLGTALPQSLVTENYISRGWRDEFYVILTLDTDIEKPITFTAKNSLFEYIYPDKIKINELNDIYDENEIYGYYFEITFEHKPWLYNNDNVWNIIVKSGDEEILNDNMIFNFSHLLFNELDNSPFVENCLNTVKVNDEYKYIFKSEDTDILVIYYSFLADLLPYTIYRPILYLLPNKSNNDFTTIIITWSDEQLKGKYYIKRYKFNALPIGNEETIVIDTITVI